MPLSKKDKYALTVMMASKKDADTLEAMFDSNGPVSNDMLRKLEIALCSKKLAAEMKDKIEAVSPVQASPELEKALDNAAASEAVGEDLEDEIEA